MRFLFAGIGWWCRSNPLWGVSVFVWVQVAAVQIRMGHAVHDSNHVQRCQLAVFIPFECCFALSRSASGATLHGTVTVHSDQRVSDGT